MISFDAGYFLKYFNPYIGVIESNDEILNKYKLSELWPDDGFGYALIGGCEILKPSDQDYGEKFNKEGDIMFIDLDLINYTLSYTINNKQHGIAFKNIKKTNYRLAISLWYCSQKKVKMQLL